MPIFDKNYNTYWYNNDYVFDTARNFSKFNKEYMDDNVVKKL